MNANVDARVCAYHVTRRKFAAYTMLRFTLALALGALIALLEHCAWLPCRLSSWINISPPKHSFLMSVTGPLLLQTLPIPLLGLAGIYRMGYPYTSRILYSLFWLLHGVDVWRFLLSASQNDWHLWPIILMILIVTTMGLVMLGVHSVATEGVCCQASSHSPGARPISYFLLFVRLWGAILILQLAFNLLYLFYIK